MKAHVRHGPYVSTEEVAVPGFPSLTLLVSGPVHARGLEQNMSQGFTVLKDGVATARAELEPAEKAAVVQLLTTQFPEHARLL